MKIEYNWIIKFIIILQLFKFHSFVYATDSYHPKHWIELWIF
jgi:hypothetical protein